MGDEMRGEERRGEERRGNSILSFIFSILYPLCIQIHFAPSVVDK